MKYYLVILSVLGAFSGLAQYRPLESIDDVRVGPLLQTAWDQRYAVHGGSFGKACYNYYTPDEVYCGCVATAFAQVLKYHEWPRTTVESGTYACLYAGTSTNMTMKGGVYDWANMPLAVGNATPEVQREAIGRLCYDVGVSLGAAYASNGTMANAAAASLSLPENFSFASSRAISYELSSNMKAYTEENFQRMVVPSLDAGLPCVLTISGDATHTVACDGYGFHNGQFMVHIVAGYSGFSDGWYHPPYFTILTVDYDRITVVNFNISPTRTGAIGSGRVLSRDGDPIANARIVVTQGGVTNTVTTTDEKGIYYFWGDAGKYTVKASREGLVSSTQVKLESPKSIYAERNTWIYLDRYSPVAIGNSAWNDIVLGTEGQAEAPTGPGTGTISFTGNEELALTAPTAGSVIHYTTDGMLPTAQSPLYTAPIALSESTTVRAIAVKEGLRNSEVSTFVCVETTLGTALDCPGLPWRTGGSYGPCFVDTGNSYDGVSSVRTAIPSVAQGIGANCWLETELKGPATLSFHYAYFPYWYAPFTVLLDGETELMQLKASWGSLQQWKEDAVSIPAGDHVVRFEYAVSQYGFPQDAVNGFALDRISYTYTGTEGPDPADPNLELPDPNPEDDPRPDTNAGDRTAQSGSAGSSGESGGDSGSSEGSGTSGGGQTTDTDRIWDDVVETEDSVLSKGGLPKGSLVRVLPLTKAMWDQGRNFNRFCPLGTANNPDGRMYAGCVATAMSILLDYYNWPPQGVGQDALVSNDGSYLSARFNDPYDWEKMKDWYGHVTSSEQALAVGRLLSDAGAAMMMTYGTDSSSANFSAIKDALVKNFLFDGSYIEHPKVTVNASFEEVFTPALHLKIQNQLADGHPILCNGLAGSGNAGHTYVLDGYAVTPASLGTVTNLYHFNFGWGGSNNGWYPLDAVFTTAVAGQEATTQKVDEMILGLYPQKAPVFLPRPEVSGPSLTVGWTLAKCWTNRLVSLTLARQERQQVEQSTTLGASDWQLRQEGFGWSLDGDTVVAKPFADWGAPVWPGCGSPTLFTKTPVAVSADTTVKITYRACRFDPGVKLKIVKCVWDEEMGEYSVEFDANGNAYPVIGELPGGSDSSLAEKELTLSGAALVAAFGENESDAHFALYFEDSNSSCSYPAGQELVRIDSISVNGAALEWKTVETADVTSGYAGKSYSGLPEGEHRFVLSADYGSLRKVVTSEQRISTTLSVPEISVKAETANAVTFTVANGGQLGYGFQYQIPGLAARSVAVSGNDITYTFNSNVADLGTHWLTLFVTNTTTKLSSKFTYVTNPPEDHPLVPYAAVTFEEAVSRATREGKLIFMLSTGEADGRKFKDVSTYLASNEVVKAVKDRYIYFEACGTYEEGARFVKQFWREQPAAGGVGSTPSPFFPELYGYGFIIDPATPTQAITTTGGLTSQLDLPVMYSAGLVVPKIVAFLNQDFGDGVSAPSVAGGADKGTLTKVGDAYVVTPAAGVREITIVNAGENTIIVPPGLARIAGVSGERVKVMYGAYDLTPVFTKCATADGLAFALDADATFGAGEEAVTVRPVLGTKDGDADVAVEPFVLKGASGVAVGVKAIPGLTYTLLRGMEPGTVVDEVVTETAEGSRIKLEDASRPAGRAFYRVRVSSMHEQ